MAADAYFDISRDSLESSQFLFEPQGRNSFHSQRQATPQNSESTSSRKSADALSVTSKPPEQQKLMGSSNLGNQISYPSLKCN